MCRTGKRIIAKLRIIDKGEVRPGVGETQGEGIAPAAQSQVLAQVAEQEQGTPTSTPRCRERSMFWKRGMVKGAPGKGGILTFTISSRSSIS